MSPSDRPAEPIATCTVALPDEAATAALAARLAATLGPGRVVWLSGGLGAGKTTLVRGVLRSLGHTGRVRSPTFTLLEPYDLPKFPVYHFDFYRFSSEDEWRDAGFDEYFRGAGTCLVEWPELAGPDLPRPDLHLRIAFAGANDPQDAADGSAAHGTAEDADGAGGRIARLEAYSEAGRACVNAAVAGS